MTNVVHLVKIFDLKITESKINLRYQFIFIIILKLSRPICIEEKQITCECAMFYEMKNRKNPGRCKKKKKDGINFKVAFS